MGPASSSSSSFFFGLDEGSVDVHFGQPLGFFLAFSFPAILSGLLQLVLKDLVRPLTVQALEEPTGHVLVTHQEKRLDIEMELLWYFSQPFVGSIHTHHPKGTHLIVLLTH